MLTEGTDTAHTVCTDSPEQSSTEIDAMCRAKALIASAVATYRHIREDESRPSCVKPDDDTFVTSSAHCLCAGNVVAAACLRAGSEQHPATIQDIRKPLLSLHLRTQGFNVHGLQGLQVCIAMQKASNWP